MGDMLDMWGEYDANLLEEVENADFIRYHSSLTHEELEACGRPTRPLEFPTPVVYEGALEELTAADHRTGEEYALKNVLRRRGNADTAYLIKKKLAKSSFGWVKLGVVLRRTPESKSGVQWQSTGDYVAIKCSSWEKMQAMRGRHLVDPIKEISVLQLIGNRDSKENHVLGCIEVLQTSEYLYTIMPYCEGGDFYNKFDISGLQQIPDEEQARLYFGQLLKALVFLQTKGICHRNVCLENLLLDSNDNLVLVDSGLSLRVPYADPANIGGVTDVSEGSTRLLMRPQGQCGQLKYLAPEMLEQRSFDGHATDLWAAIITLFITLVGVAPFSMPQASDQRFEKISEKGGLKELLTSLDVSLSREAVDLLQNSLWIDPRDRLTLAEVMNHPWVLGETFPEEVAVTASVASLPRVNSDRCLKSLPPKEAETPAMPPKSPTSTIVRMDHTKQHMRKRSGARDSLMGAIKFMRRYGVPAPQHKGKAKVAKTIPDVSDSRFIIDT